MIRIGILPGNASANESINLIQQFNDFKITGIARDIDKQDAQKQQYSAEELVRNSDATYISLQAPSFDLIRMGIKKSNHLFLHTSPVLTPEEIRQLISLEAEAGSTVLLFNPLSYLPEQLRIMPMQQVPKWINIRLPINFEHLNHQLLDLLLFICSIEKSEIRKVDAFALQSQQTPNLITTHISFKSGSVAQLELSDSSCSSQHVIEILCQNEKPISLPVNQNEEALALTEKSALKQFILAIRKKQTTIVSLSDLTQALQILHEIMDKLKYSGCSLLK